MGQVRSVLYLDGWLASLSRKLNRFENWSSRASHAYLRFSWTGPVGVMSEGALDQLVLPRLQGEGG